MNKVFKTSTRNIAILSCILLCCACIVTCFALNAIWTNDDITYRFHFKTQSPITSWQDVFSSQVAHYFVMNGRFVAHVLAQASISLWGKTIFSIVNGIAWILFICLMWMTCKISNNWKYALLVVLLAFFGLQTKYTPCFQINYIWMFSLVLAYLLLFFHLKSDYSRWWSVGLAPFSLMAGWSNESIVVGISVSMIIYAWHNRKCMTFNQWVMFFSFGAGVALLCFSPATIGRTKGEVGSVDFLPPAVYSLAKLLFYSRVTYLLVIYVLYLKIFKKASWKDLYTGGAFWIHAFVVLFVFNLCIGVFGNRQLFGMELISIILIATYWEKYTGEGRLLNLTIGLLLVWTICKVGFNCMFLQKQQRLFDYFYAEYQKSPSGAVFYDLSCKDVTFYETYPCDVFTQHVTRSMNRYFHYLDNDKSKQFKIYPTCCKELGSYKENYFENSAPGAWTVVVLKGNEPARIVEARKIEFLTWEFSLVGRNITSSDLIYEDDANKVYQIYDKVPFVKGVEVKFLK